MTRMRRLGACSLLALFLWQCLPMPALARTDEPLPNTPEARVKRLQKVAAAHQLSFAEARHAADSQLLTGAILLITSMLTPLIAEVRDENFPTLGSVLLGSIGFAIVIEGTVDEQEASRAQLREMIEEKLSEAAQADSLATPEKH